MRDLRFRPSQFCRALCNMMKGRIPVSRYQRFWFIYIFMATKTGNVVGRVGYFEQNDDRAVGLLRAGRMSIDDADVARRPEVSSVAGQFGGVKR